MPSRGTHSPRPGAGAGGRDHTRHSPRVWETRQVSRVGAYVPSSSVAVAEILELRAEAEGARGGQDRVLQGQAGQANGQIHHCANTLYVGVLN